MEKIIIVLLLACFACCNSSNNNEQDYICSQLDSILSENIMDSKKSFPVYQLFFFDIDSINYMTIEPSMSYNKNLADGFFFHQGKLIMFSYLNNKKMKKVIYEENIRFNTDTLISFTESQDIRTSFCDDPHIQKFIVMSDGSFQISNCDVRKDIHFTTDETGLIYNPQMSNVLCEYIRKNRAFMYNLYLEQFKKDYYMSIRTSAWYDRTKIKGYFYLHDNLIVLYADDGINLKNYFDISRIHYLDDSIPSRKNAPIKYLTYPYCKFYKITGDSTIVSVGKKFEEEYLFH